MKIEEVVKFAREKFPHGGTMAVAVYPDEESFKALRNPDGMSYEEHKEILKYSIAALEADGFRVEKVELRADEYFQWLGDDLNTTATRAAFVALKTGGKTNG